jgi:hypothetical protein
VIGILLAARGSWRVWGSFGFPDRCYPPESML